MSNRSCTDLTLVAVGSAGAQRDQQFAPGFFSESIEINRTFAFVAQKLDERWPTLFLGRLQLFAGDLQQVHLQGLGEEILGISAIRTRKGQVDGSVSGQKFAARARVYLNHPGGDRCFLSSRSDFPRARQPRNTLVQQRDRSRTRPESRAHRGQAAPDVHGVPRRS